jgi:hypothetical protein
LECPHYASNNFDDHLNAHPHEEFVVDYLFEDHLLNEEAVLNHSLSNVQLFDTPIYDKYYDYGDDLYKKQVVFSSSKNYDQLEDMLNLIEAAPNSDEDQVVDMNSESREHI